MAYIILIPEIIRHGLDWTVDWNEIWTQSMDFGSNVQFNDDHFQPGESVGILKVDLIIKAISIIKRLASHQYCMASYAVLNIAVSF